MDNSPGVPGHGGGATGAIPAALRQLLTKGGGGGPRQHAAQIGGVVQAVSKPAGGDSPMPSTRASLDMAGARRQHRPSDPATARGLGAWLTSLRGGSRTTASAAHTRNPSAELARDSASLALAAVAATVTAIEIRESAPAAPSSRVGRKRAPPTVVYRILVSDRSDRQWWTVRSAAEFRDLHAALRRRFAHVAGAWSDLFPSKRWSASAPEPQPADRLNVFLRTVVADPDTCACDEMQRFLAADTLLPCSTISHCDPAHRLPMPSAWATREAMERISMPVLKDHGQYVCVSQTATPPPAVGPTFLFGSPPPGRLNNAPRSAQPSIAAPMLSPPAVPPRPTKHQSMGIDHHTKSPLAAVIGEDAAALQVIRKASDSLLYVSAEKRPNIEPLTVRKKYGLRGNLQYVTGASYHHHSEQPDHSLVAASGQGPEPKESIGTIDDDIELTCADHGLDHEDNYSRDVTLVTSPSPPLSQHSSQLPSVQKSETWAAAPPHIAARESSGCEDVEMTSTEHVPISPVLLQDHVVQQAQLFRQPSQAQLPSSRSSLGRPLALPNSLTKGTNVNTLMTTLATEQQLRSPPLWSAPPTVHHFGQVPLANTPAMSQKLAVGLDDFQLLSIIGKGSYGQVMLARYKDTGKVMAIKVISKSKLRGRPNEIRRVMSERKVLERTIEHPFLVGLQCAFQTKEKLFFCLDYVNGGELFFHLQRERRFSENRARFYAAEITSALEYLHGMGVVYRDLKPENCLLDADGHVKIVDFGLAKEVGPVVWRTEGSTLYSVEDGGKTGTFCGTPEYLAPEVLLRQRYGKEVDWYCLGAVLYEMLTGLPPFYHQDNNTMYRRILHEPLCFPPTLPPSLMGNGSYNDSCGSVPGNTIGKLAQDFISRILERDPQKRLGHGVFGTESVKRHVFFHGIEWPKIYRQEYAPPFVPKVSSIFDLSNIDPEFRNEPIPDSILSEGQVDIIAEAAEAERQAELAMQAQLMAFPSPLTTPVAASSGQFPASYQHSKLGVSSPPSSINTAQRDSYASTDSNGDAFQGFAFLSPWVHAPTDQ